jgi:pyridoxine 5-phosphate synthase
MTKLSVNINKIATLRNARGGTIPDVVKAALDIENYGADGITIHPRPDERHITRQDVYDLKDVVTTEFNIEGYPGKAFIEMVCQVKPTQVTLVPDPPEVLTSNAGWDCIVHQSLLKEVIQEFKNAGIRVSIFLDPEVRQVEAAKSTGTDRIELYTEAYASEYTTKKEEAIQPYIETAKAALDMDLGINAGHDLNLKNLTYFATHIPGLLEVSIGHALISDALYLGLNNAVQMYKNRLNIENLPIS